MQKRRLKSWSHFFQAIVAREKLHDLRSEDDGQFFKGQILRLEEFDNINGVYTGNYADVRVSYITNRSTPCAVSTVVLDEGYSILSLDLLKVCNENSSNGS